MYRHGKLHAIATQLDVFIAFLVASPVDALAMHSHQRLRRPGTQELERARKQDLKNWEGQITYAEAEQAEKARSYTLHLPLQLLMLAADADTLCCLQQPLHLLMQMWRLQMLAELAFA